MATPARPKSIQSCVHFRFRLKGGHDFQAVALEATSEWASFEKHYEDPLKEAETGYFETPEGIFEISGADPPSRDPNNKNVIRLNYTSTALGPPILPDQEFRYVLEKKAALRDRHRQLQAMNNNGARSVIALYTLMLAYAAAPFSSTHFELATGFYRVWGLGGLWLALTGWFYCDRVLWKYGNHIFEQIFCMRQQFQMDKVAIGRSKLHNLYALLPSYGYSWDRLPSKITPSDDPTRLSGRRIKAAAWFFKLVNFFPVMYFFLFLSMALFGGKMMVGSTEDRIGTYLRVVLGFSFFLFLWLARSMRSCDDLLRATFRARRIGVESPWPKFPDKNVNKATSALHEWRNWVCIGIAAFVSLANFAVFVGWSVPQVPRIAGWTPHFLVEFAKDINWMVPGGITAAIFAIWMFFKERVIKAVHAAAARLWPSPEELDKRGKEANPVFTFIEGLGPVGKAMKVTWWVFTG